MKATKEELLEAKFAPEFIEYPYDVDGRRRMAGYGLRLIARFPIPDGSMDAPHNKRAVLLGMAGGAAIYLYNHDGNLTLLSYMEA